ncbi:MAG: hypothetical protein WCP81_03720 [Actinomycetes bacterium]|jgi:AAA family ATP:ADP antiporter
MREYKPPSASDSNDDDDPWAFVTANNPRNAAPTPAADAVTSDGDESDPSTTAPTSPVAGQRLQDAGEFTAMQSLKHRARPLAWALAAVFFFGFVTEVVAAARFVYLLGPTALVIIYTVGGVSLITVALLQMTRIDMIRRDKAFRLVTIVYAIAFVVAIALIANQSTTVWGTGLAWLIADQLNFLLPLIVWAIVADLFNAGEGRKIYPWVTSWQYGGQLLGLAVPAVAPLLFVPLGLPLWALLVICPIGVLIIGIWLPKVLAGRAIGRGHGRQESLSESVSSTWDFVGGVKAFRAMFVSSILVFIAAQSLEASFLSSADRALRNEAQLQVLYGSTLVVVFILCALLQKFFTTGILEKLDIPGSLAVLPIAAVASAVLIILGILAGETLPLLIVGIICWWVPRWSIGDVARHAALTVVPDEKRARVSFAVGVVPFACGLFVAGIVTFIVDHIGYPVIAPVVALVLAVAAIFPARTMMAEWSDALLDPRLRRRKRLSS